MKKTNAMRILDRKKIPYEVIEYDESWEVDGLSIALHLGLDPNCVFKTLLWEGCEKRPYVFVIPVSDEMNPKKTASLLGEKHLHLINQSELLSLTGYIRGGVSPVGMKREFPTYIDCSARELEKMIVSGGKKGLQMKISPQNLIKVTEGEFLEIVKESVYEDSEGTL